MGSFVPGLFQKGVMGLQSFGHLWRTSAGISFGSKEQQFKAEDVALEQHL